MRLIDADKLKAKVRAQEWKRDPAIMLALDWIYMLIDDSPTIDAMPVVRGEWEFGTLAWHCTNCRWRQPHDFNTVSNDTLKYCPNCGCDMRGESNGKE